MITKDILLAIMPHCYSAKKWVDALNNGFVEFGITTKFSVCAFLANAAVESRELSVLRENMNYSEKRLREVFGKVLSDEEVLSLVGHPYELAERVYGGRFGNKQTGSGDGWRFRGGGIFQLTFRDNYYRCELGTSIPLTQNPELITVVEHAVRSACWYWRDRNLSDFQSIEEFPMLVSKINKAKLEYNRRLQYLKIGLSVIGD